jgi:hypothetical protein
MHVCMCVQNKNKAIFTSSLIFFAAAFSFFDVLYLSMHLVQVTHIKKPPNKQLNWRVCMCSITYVDLYDQHTHFLSVYTHMHTRTRK